MACMDRVSIIDILRKLEMKLQKASITCNVVVI